MLPSLPKSLGNLTTVFDSMQRAIRGEQNRLALPRVSSAILVLVDGLGLVNLSERKAHAKELFAAVTDSKLYSSAPSTTAVSLAGLATGGTPVDHGVLGYSAFDRQAERVLSFLKISPEDARTHKQVWQRAHEFSVTSVGPTAYAASGFTELTFGSFDYRGANKLSDRFDIALQAAMSGSSLVYLYVPELDQIGHRFGWLSQKWVQALEDLDLEFRRADQIARKNRVGIFLTADHGMVDVPTSGHVEIAPYFPTAIAVTGDPRCRFIYLEETVDFAEMPSELNSVGFLVSYADFATAAYGAIPDGDLKPDFVLLAKEGFAFYDERFSEPKSRLIVGQHGSVSNAELRVPAVVAGGFR